MKIILKKFIIMLLVIFILISSLFSGFVYADPIRLTQERAGNYAASFAINFYDNWSSISFESVGIDSNYDGSYNGSVIEVAKKIFNNIYGRTDIEYDYSGKGGINADLVVNHPDQLKLIDCSAYVSAVLWAAGYNAFSSQQGTSIMASNCENGTYASYGFEIYKNDNQTIKKWNGSGFTELGTSETGVDFLRPGDVIVFVGTTPSGSYRHHTHIFLEKVDSNSYKSLDCGDKSDWTGPNPYITSDNIWQYSGAYVMRSPESSGRSSTSSGEYSWPLKTMVVNSEYGQVRNLFGKKEPHLGTDLHGEYGDEIFACHSGKVVQVYNGCTHDSNGGDQCGNGYGNHVRIQDENGITIIYGHMKKDTITVTQGQEVKKGDKIGEVGSSGSSTGKHLHLEFRTTDTKLLAGMTEGKDYHWSGKKNAYTIDPRQFINFASGGVATSATSGSSGNKKKAIQRGEIATKYDENAKVTDIIETNKDTYVFNNETWINFVYKYSLGMEENTLSSLLTNFDTENEIFKDELVKSGNIIDITKLVNEGKIIPGDILYVEDGQGGAQYLLYIGGTKVLYATPPGEEDPDDESTFGALRQDYLQYYLSEKKEDLMEGHEDEEDYEIPQYGVTKIYRLKESYIIEKNLSQENVDMTFNKKRYFNYAEYSGIPEEITLNKTEDIGFKWIFDGLMGIFEFILNTILYAIRMQVLGWANMVELALQSIILGLSGNSNSQMVSNFFGPDATSATGSRLTVESIFFNQIPILDANFFNFESAGGYSLVTTEVFNPATASGMAPYEVTRVDKTNIVYQLRNNLRKWYMIIRNASVAILLFVLIYLAIRYAIATTGQKKASIKQLLIAWVTAFIIVMFVHLFMYMVFEINDALVQTCKDIGQSFASTSLQNQNKEQLNLYDAVRIKAYAFNFREGIPATIIYIYMIYLLIRFSYIYLKRYITIYFLAIMGSFMGVKYAIEKISGKKTTSLGKWFKDFAFNVLLQTVHAFIYIIYMGVAINSASESLAGFFICLIVLNFMLNADKIIIKIFGLDKASSIGDVIKPESYLQLVNKFAPMFMVYGTAIKGAKNYIFGKRGLIREVQYSVKGFDNYKDAEKYFENEKYKRIGKMQELADALNKKIKGTRAGKWVTDRGESINKMLKNRGLKGFKSPYAEKRRALNSNISLETKRALYNSIKKAKQLNRKKFTRPLGFARDMALLPVGIMATTALAIADPAAGIAALQKTKKMISKHRSVTRTQRKNHVYRDRKVEEKQKYALRKRQYNTATLKYVNEKYGYNKELERLIGKYNGTDDEQQKASYKRLIDKIEEKRYNSIQNLENSIRELEARGRTSSDPKIRELQEKYREMYSAKSDIRLNADYRKAKEKYEQLLNKHVNSQYDYETKINELKASLSGISDPSQVSRVNSEISRLEKEKAKEEAKGLQQLQESYEKMEEEKILYRNAKYERNHVVKALGAVTGASLLAEMAQNEAEGMYNDKAGTEKELKILDELQKFANDETELRRLMGQIKTEYGANEEDAYNRDMADLIKDAKKTTVKSSMIKSVISSYMYDNNVKKINEDNIDDILDKLAEKLSEAGSGIIISDELKKQVRKQLEDKMIADSKGLGYDKKDATVAIETILGQDGMIETRIKGSDVSAAISTYMKNTNTSKLDSTQLDEMINEVQETLRADIPASVRDKIRQDLEAKLTEDRYRDGLDKSTISDVINSEIKANNIEDTSRYHKSLTREQIKELKSAGIAINTEEYYQYLENHNIDDVAIERARNEARQKAREMNVRNENAKVKHGRSLTKVNKVLHETF